MRDSYDEVIQRCIQCRQQKGMIQDELSARIGITQSEYSKMERRKVIIPFKGLKVLWEAGADVDYLITGKKSPLCSSELSSLVSQTDMQEKRRILSSLAGLLEHGIEKSVVNISFETKCELGILKRRVSEESTHSVLYEIRRVSGLAQIPMAEKLGVNIKKYRMLEKEKTEPDAELLLRLYEETGCRPSLLFETADIEGKIIDDLWSQITPDIRQTLLPLAEQVLSFFRS